MRDHGQTQTWSRAENLSCSYFICRCRHKKFPNSNLAANSAPTHLISRSSLPALRLSNVFHSRIQTLSQFYEAVGEDSGLYRVVEAYGYAPSTGYPLQDRGKPYSIAALSQVNDLPDIIPFHHQRGARTQRQMKERCVPFCVFPPPLVCRACSLFYHAQPRFLVRYKA